MVHQGTFFQHGRHCIQHTRFTKQDGWELWDLSLDLNGNIAISCYNEKAKQTSIDVYSVRNSDSRDKPKIFYSKEFEIYEDEDGWEYWGRCVSFVDSYGDNSGLVLATGLGDKLELFDLIQDRVLKSRKVTLVNHGGIKCLSVRDRREIFIGFLESNKITVYDVIDLNEIKSIILQGIQDGYWPWDMTAIADRIFVCVGYDSEESNDRSLIFEEKNGRILSELTKPTDTHWYTTSITVSVTLGVVAVVWCDSYYSREGTRFQIIFYSLLSENISSFLIVEVESGVYRIRISDRGDRMVTMNWWTGEVKVYDMADVFIFHQLKTNLTSQLQDNDCEILANFFAFPKDQIDSIIKSDTPTENLLLALEEKGLLQASNVGRLADAFTELEINSSCYNLVDFYQKTRMQATLYGRFLATLSAHLTASLPADLCGYFNITDEKKSSITSSQNPGLSLLLAVDEMGIIQPSEVEALNQPFTEFRLVQAAAKVDEYQSTVEEEKNQLQRQTELSKEGKKELFIQCLQKKIKSWYETMTPVPWKKSCQWKSTDLFVGSGLVLTDSKAKRSLTDIDEECKLQYTQILVHNRLKAEKRIILEGEPGSGKTMMSSQVAYDWSQGKIKEVDVLLFLPLKFVNNVTLVEAMKRFYFSAHDNITVNDIESFLTNQDLQSCLILDGLEEYNSSGTTPSAGPSEVVKVMEKSKYPNCKVILTSRSDYAKDLPACPMLRIGKFGEKERTTYIEKVFANNTERQQEIKRVIENTPFILDLCSVPLLFVLAVHNIESMGRLEEGQLERVSPFMENMVRTLCSSSNPPREESASDVVDFSYESPLEEVAYNGLCKGQQILSWQKDNLERNISNLKQFLDSGILVVEEGIVKGRLRNIQDETKENEPTQKKKQAKKRKKEATIVDQMNESTPEVAGAMASPMQEKHFEEEASNKNVAVASGIQVFYEKEEHTSRRKRLLKRLTPKIFSKKKDLYSGKTTDETVSSVRADLPTREQVKDYNDPVTREPAETPPVESESTQSESEAESELSESQKASSGSTAKDFPLEVKFLHKVMQEWFASKYFSSMLWKSWNDNSHQELLYDVLPQISPIDLHYILRFTSYLCPPSCSLIMDYLLQNHQTADGAMPEYIMNYVCLCFAEYNGHMEHSMKDVVCKVCKENISIRSDDSRLLQQSKIALMRFAASNGILIKGVQLVDVVAEVDEKSLTFNSGFIFDTFNMIEVIEISRWDQHLQGKDYRIAVKLVLRSQSIRKARLYFPSPPPEIDKETLDDEVMYDKTVEWIIGPRLIQTLNMETGKWQVTFNRKDVSFTGSREEGAILGTSAISTTTPIIQETVNEDFTELPDSKREAPVRAKKQMVDSKREDEKLVESEQLLEYQMLLSQPLPETDAVITKTSATISIPGTDVVLKIPSGALPEHVNECAVKMRIIPRKLFKDPEITFSSNSSVVLEILPNSLVLKHPAQLMVPHCLLLKENKAPTAKIFMSHHNEGCLPCWEEHTDLEYRVEMTRCVVWMNSFCWVTIKVDNKDVWAKHLILYSCGEKLNQTDEYARTAVGYYPDLDGEGKFLSLNKSMAVSERIPFVFMKEGSHPLCLLLEKFSSKWELWVPGTPHVEIAFEDISSSFEIACKFIFQKTGDGAGSLMCSFKAYQEQGQQAVNLAICPEKLNFHQDLDSHKSDISTRSRSGITLNTDMESVATRDNWDILPSQSKEKYRTPDEHLRDCFMFLKTNLAENWRDLGRYLTVSEDELRRLSKDYRDDIGECTYQMLLCWQQMNGLQATPEKLKRSLKKLGRKDLAEMLEALYREDEEQGEAIAEEGAEDMKAEAGKKDVPGEHHAEESTRTKKKRRKKKRKGLEKGDV